MKLKILTLTLLFFGCALTPEQQEAMRQVAAGINQGVAQHEEWEHEEEIARIQSWRPQPLMPVQPIMPQPQPLPQQVIITPQYLP
jgi:hypothetical protein